MVNHMKATALNKRVNEAVGTLKRLHDRLRAELAKQEPFERPPGSSKYSEETYPETIELRRTEIEALADHLRYIRLELEERTWRD